MVDESFGHNRQPGWGRRARNPISLNFHMRRATDYSRLKQRGKNNGMEYLIIHPRNWCSAARGLFYEVPSLIPENALFEEITGKEFRGKRWDERNSGLGREERGGAIEENGDGDEEHMWA